MSAMFSPVRQHGEEPQGVIIGGTRSGQIVVWDIRAGPNPVLLRPPSKKTHTYPIYCLEAVFDDGSSSAAAAVAAALVGDGTQDDKAATASSAAAGSTVASLSSDGKICIWSLRNLAQPVDTCDVQLNFRATEVTAMALPAYATAASSNFVFGCDDGSISTYSARSKIMIGTVEKATGPMQHVGPVLGIDFHPLPRGSLSSVAAFDPLSRLFLSCSADWSVKLWTSAPRTTAGASLDSTAPQPTGPRVLHSFADSGDCVFDARWSPAHPSVFATGDGQGRLCAWDISTGLDAPIMEVAPCSGGSSPITRVAWNPRGNCIAAGDSRGTVNVLSVCERWQSSKMEDWVAFDEIIRKKATLMH
jgi:dynein intermediate chain